MDLEYSFTLSMRYVSSCLSAELAAFELISSNRRASNPILESRASGNLLLPADAAAAALVL